MYPIPEFKSEKEFYEYFAPHHAITNPYRDATGTLHVKDLGQLASIINQLREVEHIQYQKYLEKQKPIVKKYGGIFYGEPEPKRKEATTIDAEFSEIE